MPRRGRPSKQGLGPPCVATQDSDRWSWVIGLLELLRSSGKGCRGAPRALGKEWGRCGGDSVNVEEVTECQK